MARTNIDIDEKACAAATRRYQLKTKRDAINFALRSLAAEPLPVDQARKLPGSGRDGDLDEMRTDRIFVACNLEDYARAYSTRSLLSG